jgi:hypothetical protein
VSSIFTEDYALHVCSEDYGVICAILSEDREFSTTCCVRGHGELLV